MEQLAGLPAIPAHGGWSLLFDAEAAGTTARDLSAELLEHKVAATPMTAWGETVAHATCASSTPTSPSRGSQRSASACAPRSADPRPQSAHRDTKRWCRARQTPPDETRQSRQGSDVALASMGKEHSAGRSAALPLLVQGKRGGQAPRMLAAHECKRSSVLCARTASRIADRCLGPITARLVWPGRRSFSLKARKASPEATAARATATTKSGK